MSSGGACLPLSQMDEELPPLIYLSAFRHHSQPGINVLEFFNLLVLLYVSVTLGLLPLLSLQMTLSLLTLTVVGVSYQSNSLFL